MSIMKNVLFEKHAWVNKAYPSSGTGWLRRRGRDGKETENLGDKIREYRRIHGLTQKELAQLVGVDQTTLADWERG